MKEIANGLFNIKNGFFGEVEWNTNLGEAPLGKRVMTTERLMTGSEKGKVTLCFNARVDIPGKGDNCWWAYDREVVAWSPIPTLFMGDKNTSKQSQGMSLTDEIKAKIDDYFDNTPPEQINKDWGLVKNDIYEITEINEHEGDTFGYIIKLTDEQVDIIKEYFDAHNEEWDYEVKSIREFELTSEEVDLINRYNSGAYNKRLKYMRLSEQFKPDASVLRDMDFAYKGSGMVEEKYTQFPVSQQTQKK